MTRSAAWPKCSLTAAVGSPTIFDQPTRSNCYRKLGVGSEGVWFGTSPAPSRNICTAMPGTHWRRRTMLQRNYDPMQPYHIVEYGRMSDPRQNKRSPDQQFDTIDETIRRAGYPWKCLATYRDDGKSGRYLSKRPGLQRLLRDVECGLIQIDLIGVDTLERLGRADEIAELRRKLFVNHGVLVVAADNGFTDPTGVVGKAVGMVEQIRSTENTRVSRHNVLRGKKDAARLGRWPGGPRPFGFKFKPVIDSSVTPPDVFNVLELEAREAAAMRLAFQRAADTSHGDLRLSKWWNTSPDIPADFKPISTFTMGYRLENPIAIGTLRWGANRTDIVNDTRVVEPNPHGAEMIPNFCPALVSVELYERVQRLRQLRGNQIRAIRKARKGSRDDPAKLIAPQARGLTLNYLLTGLVRCGCCNASMRPVASGRKSKAGKRYTYYVCPRYYDRACSNGYHVPEDALRAAVISRLRVRLFPLPNQTDSAPAWLPELLAMVRQEHHRLRAVEPDQAAADREELRQLDQQLMGWSMTLAHPELPASVRGDIVARYDQAKQRQEGLLRAAAARRAMQEYLDRSLDPQQVMAALRRLDEILAGYNPTLGNLELSKHIDVITCYPDGRVEMRGTRLGLLEGAIELLGQGDGQTPPTPREPGGYAPIVPRRRGRLRVPDLSVGGEGLSGTADTSLDPQRFEGLPEAFFWNESIMLEPTKCWSEEHAAEVARERATGKTQEELAALFGVTPPTIRKALRIAVQADPGLQNLPKKQPRQRWPEQHCAEVAELRRQGLSMAQLCHHFQRSEPLIRTALQLAADNDRRESTQTGGAEPAPR
jgi:DNA invertase Pin-like site-specific DNA recombinase